MESPIVLGAGGGWPVGVLYPGDMAEAGTEERDQRLELLLGSEPRGTE